VKKKKKKKKMMMMMMMMMTILLHLTLLPAVLLSVRLPERQDGKCTCQSHQTYCKEYFGHRRVSRQALIRVSYLLVVVIIFNASSSDLRQNANLSQCVLQTALSSSNFILEKRACL
jgi:hypothetical protein